MRQLAAGVRVILLGSIAVASLTAACPVASAQSEGLAPRLLNGDVPLLPDGVLIFAYDVTAGMFAQETIVVTDGFESVVPGMIEGPFVDTGPIITTPSTMFWRPAQPFTAGKRYKVDTVDIASGERRAFVIEIATEPIERAIDPAWLTLELGAHVADNGAHTACCENDDKPSRCFAPSLMLAPELKINVDASSSSPYLRQLLFQTFSAEMMTATFWVHRAFEAAALPLDRQRDEYCLQVSAYDAAARSLVMLPELCIENQPELFEDTVPKEPENIAAALSASGCERPPEGFEEAWCESNKTTCFRVGWHGCQHFDELCPDYPRETNEPGSDTGIVDEHDAGADGGFGPGGSSGCACAIAAPRAPRVRWMLGAAGMLLMLARVRRRAIRS